MSSFGKGRPKKNQDHKRSVQIRVRMSISELVRIKKKAKEYGMTISALMRQGALTYLPPDNWEVDE